MPGKLPSVRERLISVVIGVNRASRQDLRRLVGIISSEQVESEEARIASLTSSVEAREKLLRDGGGIGGLV